MSWIPEHVLRLAAALAIGLLLGAEREHRQREQKSVFGVRTFALVGLLGGVAAQLGSELVLAVTGGVVALAVVATYALGDRADPGLTTEVAVVLTFFLGAYAQVEPAAAGAYAVVTTILLAAHGPLHRFLRTIVTDDELRSALVFAAAAVVVLPLAPDRALDPVGVINPYKIWRLVVLVMAISGVGYVALRAAGPGAGLPVAGFAGGFISGIATVGAMGARAREHPRLVGPAAVGAVWTTVATFAQLAIVLAATSTTTLWSMRGPLVGGAGAALLYGLLATRWGRGAGDDRHEGLPHAMSGRPFALRQALTFSLIVTVVLFASALAARAFGRTGIGLAAALAGFADSHAPAISTASLVAARRLAPEDACVPVLLALSTNMVSKAVAGFGSGPRRFGWIVTLGLGIVTAAAWAGWLVSRSNP